MNMETRALLAPSPRHRARRLIIAAIAVVGLTTTGNLLAIEPAEAAQFTAKTLDAVNVRSGPGTSHSVVKSFKKGVKVGINCWTNGSSVTGPYGKSKIWYQVEGVKNGWITDAWIYTGKNAPVTSQCSSNSGTNKTAALVDQMVSKHTGKRVFNHGYAQCVAVFNLYTESDLKKGFVPASYAHQLYGNAPSSKYEKLSANATPRKGDIAIWKSSLPGSGGTGHVAIVLKNNGSKLEVFDQYSDYRSIAKVRTNVSKGHLAGYLRPKM